MTERDDLRRKAPWLLVSIVVFILVWISGLAGCHSKQSSDDTDAQAVLTAMLSEDGQAALSRG